MQKPIRCPDCGETAAIHRKTDGTLLVYCPTCEAVVAVANPNPAIHSGIARKNLWVGR